MKRLVDGLFVVYCLIFIVLTIFKSFLHITLPDNITQTAVLITMLMGVVHCVYRNGWRNMLLLFTTTFLVSLAFECVGAATGLIYGKYHYTDSMGKKFLGLVPLLIPATWFMMTYPASIIAERTFGKKPRQFGHFATVTLFWALIMTSWDLLIDPLMVYEKRWIWENGGAYFGIPLQNYFGWIITTIAIASVYFILQNLLKTGKAESRRDRDAIGIALFAITCLSEMCYALDVGLGGPVIAASFALTPWIILAYRDVYKKH